MSKNSIISFFLLFIFHAKSISQENPLKASDTLVVDDGDVVKRKFPLKLKEKYSGEEYIYEYDSGTKGWFTRLKEWLANKFKSWFNYSSDSEAIDVVDFLMKTFYVLIIVAVIFIIVKAILNKEGNWVFGRVSDKKIIKVDDIENNIHTVDFTTLIEKAISKNDYRLAIRYYYLWVLKELTKKEYIEYDVEKTNSDYLFEIEDYNLKNDFGYASYLYNYIWYGEFKVEDAEFKKALAAFKSLITTIS